MIREYEMESLQGDIVVPELVQRKAELAFRRIQVEIRERERIAFYRKKRGRRFWVSIAVAAAVMGAVTACTAAYIRWNKGLEEEFHVTAEQKNCLEDNKITALLQTNICASWTGMAVPLI